MSRSRVPRLIAGLLVSAALPAAPPLAEGAAPFDASPLVTQPSGGPPGLILQ